MGVEVVDVGRSQFDTANASVTAAAALWPVGWVQSSDENRWWQA